MFNRYDSNLEKISENLYVPLFCKKYSKDENKKCKKFYQKMKSEDECEKICPYGFACIKTKDNIYTSLLIRELIDYKKVTRNLAQYKEKIDDFSLYNKNDILSIIQSYEKIVEIKDLYSQTVHDVKNANKSMMDLSEEIESNNEIQTILNKHSELKSLAEGYGLIKYRLDYHDWVINEEKPFNSRCSNINIHKIITKLKHQLKYRAKKKNINIIVEGESHNNHNQRVALFLGFFLLLENAIKYSPTDKTVTISMKDIDDKTEVTIKNECSKILDYEIPKLKQRHFRSQSAVLSSSGRGLGLDLAESIFADAMSNLEISYKPKDNSEEGIFSASVTLSNIK